VATVELARSGVTREVFRIGNSEDQRATAEGNFLSSGEVKEPVEKMIQSLGVERAEK